MFAHLDLEVVTAIAIYSTCSVSMILLNKLVMYTYGLDYPMGLLFMQNASALGLVATAKAFGFVHYPDFDMRVVRKWMPLTVLFVGMLFTSMKSLSIMSVAVQTILKNLAIVLTALGDAYFFDRKLSIGMFASFALMFVGAYLGSASDRWVTAWGLFWTFANIIFTVAYVLYMKLLLGDVSHEIGRYGPVFYNNLLSLPFLVLPSLPTLGPLVNDIASAPNGAHACLFFMMLVGSGMTFATFWCMKATSPTTYAVTGALNKIPLAVLGIFIFKQHPTAVGAIGIAFALAGGMLYTWLNRPKPKPPVDDVEDPMDASKGSKS
jgi:GDP-mannose transporter